MPTDSHMIMSVHNPKIRQMLLLQQKSSERRKKGLFVVEGQRELRHCIEARYEIDSVFCLHDTKAKIAGLLGDRSAFYEVTQEVYSKIAYRGTTEGVVATVRSKEQTLDDIKKKDNPLLVVLEKVEKPGNLGAVMRSADASGADAVIVCDPLTDIYNPNLIRSSIGAVFTVPCIVCNSQECIAWLKHNGIQILTAQLQDSKPYYDFPMISGTAIVMGTEATGLTDTWRNAADGHICIPMIGKLDSLNVSASAAILMYEAVRQRATQYVQNKTTKTLAK